MKLVNKKCVPCEGNVPPLKDHQIKDLMHELGKGWMQFDTMKISKRYNFVNFKHTMEFVNKVAKLAEEEGHHPDLHVSYGYCIVDLWTHAINGLSENDFILAAKIDALA